LGPGLSVTILASISLMLIFGFSMAPQEAFAIDCDGDGIEDSGPNENSVKSCNDGGGLRGACGDCSAPTLGLDHKGKRIVENGFTYNGQSVDAKRYDTPFPLITAVVGKPNVAELIIYENRGTDKLYHVGLAFGLRANQVFADSQAIIEWDRDFTGEEKVTQIDPDDVIDDKSLRVVSSTVKCTESAIEEKCTKLTIYHKFRAPLDFDVVMTSVWDHDRNGWQNIFNHGVHVTGKSLNEPIQHKVSDDRRRIIITEIYKDTAVDVKGNIWTFDKSWKKQFVPTRVIDDGVTMHLFDRNDNRFNTYKQGQELLAKQTLAKICPSCIDESFEEINNTHSYGNPEYKSRQFDSTLKTNIAKEMNKAEQTYQSVYGSFDRIQSLQI